MGLMTAPAVAGSLTVMPHPVLLDGQFTRTADLRLGESLYAFLMRHVEDLDGRQWQVTIGGRSVPRHLWHHVRPKHGQVIELRGAVGRAAIAIVAMIALTYFTMGIGTAMVSAGYGAAAVAAVQAGVYLAGSLLINRVLQPKQPKAGSAAANSYSLGPGRNRMRPNEPLGLLLGSSMLIAPDYVSQPYTYYEGGDQFLAMQFTPGINVDAVEALYNGDALLSSYEGVRVWHNGFTGMPADVIPLHSNAVVTEGGTLLDTSNEPKGRPGTWVERTSAADTIRLSVGIEFQLLDRTSKGKDKENLEQIQIQYRATGAAGWQSFGSYTVRGSTAKTQRVSYGLDVPPGQYDVRVRTAGLNTDGSGAQASFTWTTLTSVRPDPASYDGIPRIATLMKAGGQLNGVPDEIRCVALGKPLPVWKGDRWVTERTSNPGALVLAYARGFYSPSGRLLAGMALPDRQIDIEGLKAFMLHCAANNLTYTHWISEIRNHQQVLDPVALAGFGQITWPRGRLSVAWAADEQPLSGVVNMATIKKGQFQVDYTLANAADGIEYTYFDRATRQNKTLRVPAPGVTTMLNPAQIAGEGVDNEAHAALMARYHLAQSLYQYKAISYSTDLEHMSYSRMSMLALQHDMTQWGFGGRIMGAAVVNSRMVLQLDEPVPAPPQGNAFVGLRIPGERVYRVLRVEPFTGTAKELTLAEPWPRDATVPGNTEANPAWDTLWIYDFKQTPGLRVRVTGIRPESDLKGAAVEVVAESREFWHYVKTGEYIPSPNDSLLQTRPVASELKITERQVVQGDTEFTELQATYAVTGPVGDTMVLSDLDGNGELEEVARTVTRTASWRIPGAGTYPITVRPYSPEGAAGVAASLIYTTRGADAPPVLVDLFDVEQLSGGVRRYTWGFFSDTIQSANFAGVEIRYAAGTVEAPNWATMTPLGDDGYHPSAFEAVLPEAGQWTFAIRSRNTAGTLSTGMLILVKELQANLGEVIGGMGDRIDETYEQALAANNKITQEILDRVEDVRRVGDAAAADATAKAAAARSEAMAAVNALAAEVGEIVNAPEWSWDTDYAAGWLVRSNGGLYRAKIDSRNVTPHDHPETWEYLGQYSSVADVAAAALQTATTTANELKAEAARLQAVVARMPAGGGTLASEATVAGVDTASAERDRAQGRRTDLIEARLPEGNDQLAPQARVTAVANASVDRDMVLGDRTAVIEARMPAGAGGLATEARVTTVEQAMVEGDRFNASAITEVRGGLSGGGNLLSNSDFVASIDGWQLIAQSGVVLASDTGFNSGTIGDATRYLPLGYNGLLIHASNVAAAGSFAYYGNSKLIAVKPGQPLFASVLYNAYRCNVRIFIGYYDAAQNYVGYFDSEVRPANGVANPRMADMQLIELGPRVMPANAAYARVFLQLEGRGENNPYAWFMQPMLEVGVPQQTKPSPWSAGNNEATVSQAIQALTVANNASTAITRVQQGQSGSGNLLPNAGFLGVTGWTRFGNTTGLPAETVANPGTLPSDPNVYTPGNVGSLMLRVTGTPAAGTYLQVANTDFIPVAKGENLLLSAWINAFRCKARVILFYYDMAGLYLGRMEVTQAATGLAPATFNNLPRPSVLVPILGDNVGFVRGGVELLSDGQVNPYVWFIRPLLEKVPAGKTVPSPWNEGASGIDAKYAAVTQTLEARAVQLENGQTVLMGRAGVVVDVNNRVIGWAANNDGKRGIFDIVADALNVSDPSGTGSTTFEAGRWVTRSGGYMQVHGKPFGQTGDLMMYLGIGSDPNAASKANGIFWIDNKGNSYFGGSLSAGTLRNAVQTGTTQTIGTELLNGPFRTNGGNRTVTLSFARTHQRQRAAGGTSGFVAGAGANTAQVQLFRQIGTGGWVLWQVLSVTGSVNITNETDGPDTAVSGWSGSFTVNDSSSPQETVSYLARVVAFGEQAVTHQAGSFDAQTLTQNLSIISVEQ